MKFRSLFPLLLIAAFFVCLQVIALVCLASFVMPANGQQTPNDGGIRLIEPIKETAPMDLPQARSIMQEQFYRNWGIGALGIDQIKERTGLSGKGVFICVCDTGEPTHKDLEASKVKAANFTGDSFVDDRNGHATHVGGIINEIAPDAGILYAKVLTASGSGSEFTVAKGIRWCVQQGAHVVNLSLGGSQEAPYIKEAIDEATAKDVVVVAAAGNNGRSATRNTMGYPARYFNTLAVGSINDRLLVSDFSSSSPNPDEGDIVAPGEQVLSTYLDQQYIVLSGTSMAAPFVGGLSALYLEAKDTPELMEQLFEATAIDISPAGFDRYSFYGISSRALYSEIDSTLPPDTPVVVPPDDPAPPSGGSRIVFWPTGALILAFLAIGVTVFLISRKKK